jgi:hypothetical protein
MNKLPKLVCKNVWKLYGDKPKEFLHQHNNNPDQETIKKLVTFKLFVMPL